MSGVFGVIAPHRSSELRGLAEGMAAGLTHAPWFVKDSLVVQDEGIALGRIGIGVFNSEVQPVWNQGKTLALFMAGELYGRRASAQEPLDSTDEEHVLALYEDLGDEFVSRLNGTFVVAIWDSRRQRLIIANDRCGLYPVYYTEFEGTFAFAPEVGAILKDASFARRIDLTAVAEYVRFQHLLGDKTFVEGIRFLPNGSLLCYDLKSKRLSLRRYWDFSDLPALPSGIPIADAAEEAGRLLHQAVQRRLEGAGTAGVFLSGGLDSRAILGMIGRERMPVPTVTFGLRGSRDVVYGARIARSVGSDHHWLEFADGAWVLDYVDEHLRLTEGFHSWIHSHGISILDQVRDLMQVNLTGFHGAELNWEDRPLIDACDDLAFDCRLFQLLTTRTTWPCIDEAEEMTLYAPPMANLFRGRAWQSLRHETAQLSALPPALRAASMSFSTDLRFYHYYSVFNRSRIEQRFPFCDYEYFAYVHALPPKLLFDRALRRAVIRSRLPALARIPYDKDDLPITGHPLSRMWAMALVKVRTLAGRGARGWYPEHGTLHSDYEGWLRSELRPWGEELLLGERAASRGLFRQEAVRSLWGRLQSGIEPNIIGKLAPLMTLEMLFRQLIDETPADHVLLPAAQ
jgi:asparagine synthase (glutamine-hydrolysing)